MNFELRVDVLNVFDNVNFNPFDWTTISNTLNTAYTNASFGQVNAAYQDSNNTFDPGRPARSDHVPVQLVGTPTTPNCQFPTPKGSRLNERLSFGSW